VISHHPSVGPSPITLTNFFSATKGMNSMKLHRKLPSMTLQKYNKPFRFNNNEMADMSFCRKNICFETTKQNSMKLYRKLPCMTLNKNMSYAKRTAPRFQNFYSALCVKRSGFYSAVSGERFRTINSLLLLKNVLHMQAAWRFCHFPIYAA